MKSTKGFEAQKRKLTRNVSRYLYRYTRGRVDIHKLASAGMEGSRSVNDLQSQLEASVPIRSRTMSETSISDVVVEPAVPKGVDLPGHSTPIHQEYRDIPGTGPFLEVRGDMEDSNIYDSEQVGAGIESDAESLAEVLDRLDLENKDDTFSHMQSQAEDCRKELTVMTQDIQRLAVSSVTYTAPGLVLGASTSVAWSTSVPAVSQTSRPSIQPFRLSAPFQNPYPVVPVTSQATLQRIPEDWSFLTPTGTYCAMDQNSPNITDFNARNMISSPSFVNPVQRAIEPNPIGAMGGGEIQLQIPPFNLQPKKESGAISKSHGAIGDNRKMLGPIDQAEIQQEKLDSRQKYLVEFKADRKQKRLANEEKQRDDVFSTVVASSDHVMARFLRDEEDNREAERVREEEATLRREQELHDIAAKMVAHAQPQMPTVTVPVPTNPFSFPNKPVTTGIVSSSVGGLQFPKPVNVGLSAGSVQGPHQFGQALWEALPVIECRINLSCPAPLVNKKLGRKKACQDVSLDVCVTGFEPSCSTPSFSKK